MSQIVYTELEGEPIRWPYMQAIPIDQLKTLSEEYKSFNVSITETDVIYNTNTGTANNVYGPNQIGQIFYNSSTAKKITKILLYGLKTGAPPNPLYAEIRQAKFVDTDIEDITSFAAKNYTTLKSTQIMKLPFHFFKYIHPNKIVFEIKRVGNPSDLTVKLMRENEVLILESFSSSSIPTDSYQSITINLRYNVRYFDDTYTLRFETVGDDNNYYIITGLPQSSISTKTITTSSTTEKLLTYLPVNLPAGKRVILLWMIHNGGGSSSGCRLFIRKEDNTLLANTDEVANNAIRLYNNCSGGLIAFDPNGLENETYIVGWKNNLNNYALAVSVFNVDYGDYASGSASVAAGATVQVASKTLTLEAGKYVIISMLEISGNGSANYSSPAGTVRLKIDNTTVASNEFSFTVAAYHGAQIPLVHVLNLTSAANKTISIEYYNNTTNATTICGRWVIFKVPDAYYVDGASTAVGTTDTTLANISTTITAGQTVISLASLQGTYAMTFKLKMDGSNEFAYPIIDSRYSAPLMFNVYTTQIDNASFQATAAASATGYYGEAKLAVFVINPDKVWSGYILPSIFLKGFYPYNVVASGNIASASVGTTAAWITITLSSPIVLRPNEYYLIVVYTIGGDSSNYYVIHSGAISLTQQSEFLITSNNAGYSWSYNTSQNLSFKLSGYVFQIIYSGSLPSPPKIPEIAVAINELKVKAQTSGTAEFAGFDDYVYATTSSTTTSTTPTIVTVLSSTAPRKRMYVRPLNRFEIWAANVGLTFSSYYQTYAYYINPVLTPRAVGFSELYLLQVTATSNGSLAIVNDRVIGAIYLASSGDRFIVPSNFKVPVKRIEIMSGTMVFDLIGVR